MDYVNLAWLDPLPYKISLVLCGQTLSWQGAYQLEIINTSAYTGAQRRAEMIKTLLKIF